MRQLTIVDFVDDDALKALSACVCGMLNTIRCNSLYGVDV